MGVIERDAAVSFGEPRDLGAEGVVIGREIEPAALGDLSLVWRFAGPVKRLAVERRRRAQLGRRLAGIERGAAGIAVDVDDRARNRGPHDRRAEVSGEGVKSGICQSASRRASQGLTKRGS